MSARSERETMLRLLLPIALEQFDAARPTFEARAAMKTDFS